MRMFKMDIKEFYKKKINHTTPEKYEELVKKMQKEYDKPVKGMFEFLDAPGGWIEFTERTFKGQPILTIKIAHGEICELPMGIVKRLNNTKKKVRSFGINSGALRGNELPARGLPSSYTVESRLRFTSMDVL